MLAHLIEGPSEAPKTALILHGILGSARNWRGFARKLLPALPGWKAVLVDLRNHGDSNGLAGPHTVAACAQDLIGLIAQLGPVDAVVGHSFGGKVALGLSALEPPGLERCWVLDSSPGRVTESTDVSEVIAGLRRVPMPARRRADVRQHLLEQGFSEMIAAWMTTNLRARDEGLIWRFDLDAVEAMIADYYALDQWPLLQRTRTRTTVLRAERSDRWGPEILERFELLGPLVDLRTLPDAGHWVHVDNPDGLVAALAEDLRG